MSTDCVTRCGTDASGYYLCHRCTHALVAELRRVGDLTTHLDHAIARQTSTQSGVGVASRSAERPLPVNLGAADVARDLHNVLGTWAADIAERTGRPLVDSSSTPAIARWLLGSTATMRTHPAAAELHDEITDALARGWRVVDRPAPRHFAGPCDHCDADLYARPNAAELRCTECGTTYNATDRRAWLLDQARDQLATPSTIARALPGLLGRSVTPAMIRGYAHRGRLAPRPADAAGRNRYRVGDVIDLVMST